MSHEIIEVDEEGKVHGQDPNYIKGEGEQLSAHTASAWSIAVELREKAGRGDLGRQAAVIATKLEEVRALIAYWNLDQVRIKTEGGANAQGR